MKRFLSFLLAMALLFSLPCVSFAEKDGFNLNVTGFSYGLDILDDLLQNMSLNIQAAADEDGTFILNGALNLTEEKSFRLILTANDKEIGFRLPDVDEKYYCFDTQELLSELTKIASKNVTSVPVTVNVNSLLSLKEFVKFFEKYGEIVSGIFTPTSLTRTHSEYLLEGIGESVECDVIYFAPDKTDWRAMLRKLLSTLKTDEHFKDYLENALSSLPESEDGQSVEQLMDTFYAMIDKALADVDTASDFLSRYSVTIAHNGDRLHALKLEGEDVHIGYESYGDPSDIRFDVLAMYGEEPAFLAVNQFSAAEGVLEDLFYIPAFDATLSFVYNEENSETYIKANISDFGISLSLTEDDGVIEISLLVDATDFGGELKATCEEMPLTLSVPDAEKVYLHELSDLEELFGNFEF